ncbi:MAG: SLAC1 anion channel family protein [Candidatus Goldbacteria bacterium]|nr:SLAC1 anion channel family protein [Candidatus Goldiibacteriota bacterium]
MEKPVLVSKLQYFPVTVFSIIMGISGLAIAFYRAYHLGWFPFWPYFLVVLFDGILFILFLFVYGLKMIKYPEEVKAEYGHKIKINFFSAVSISFLLVSVAFYGYLPMVSMVLWYAGVAMHVLLTFHTVAFWIRGTFEVHNVNPSWFIPIVGNLIIPVVGVDLAPVWVNVYFFITGIFFWVILFSIVLYRLVFHHQLAAKFVPTMFILIAPPAVIFISYFRMFMNVDFFSLSMLMLSFFFLGLLLFLVKDFFKIDFFLSWWAYTFPISAFAIALMIAFQSTNMGIFKYSAVLVLLGTILLIGVVLFYTAKNVIKGKICVVED